MLISFQLSCTYLDSKVILYYHKLFGSMEIISRWMSFEVTGITFDLANTLLYQAQEHPSFIEPSKYLVSRGYEIYPQELEATRFEHAIQSIIKYFQVIVTGENAGYAKGNPKFYDFDIQQKDITHSQNLFIGDDPYFDIEIPQQLGHGLSIYCVLGHPKFHLQIPPLHP